MTGSWTQPRRPPDSLLPAVAGTAVVFLALPVFLLQGWRIDGWALGAFLWLASQAFGLLLHRLHALRHLLAVGGLLALRGMFRAIAVMVVVFVAAVSDPWVGLAAALVDALGFTAELGLSLVAYYTGPTAGKAAE